MTDQDIGSCCMSPARERAVVVDESAGRSDRLRRVGLSYYRVDRFSVEELASTAIAPDAYDKRVLVVESGYPGRTTTR